MTIVLVILHVMVSLFLVGVVLIQSGKGAEIGASFGSASSHTIFGSRGPGSFLGKLTTICAIVFMITSFSLAFIGKKGISSSVIPRRHTEAPAPATSAAPEAPAAPTTTAEPKAPPAQSASPAAPAEPAKK